MNVKKLARQIVAENDYFIRPVLFTMPAALLAFYKHQPFQKFVSDYIPPILGKWMSGHEGIVVSFALFLTFLLTIRWPQKPKIEIEPES